MSQQPERAEKKSIDVAARKLQELKAVFPEAFKDGAVDFSALRSALGDIPENKKGEEFFGLSWAGRAGAERAVLEPSRMTLVPKPEESVRWDEAKNLIIEGDNLEVLKLLLARYAGQVKVIYIDPPYNTGKDFVYRDDFRKSKSAYLAQTGQKGDGGVTVSTNPETSGRYHSDWLSMIYPRLKVARELLKDDGVIFVSIDDHEMHHLRMVTDEIFGEDNFLSSIVWRKRSSPDARTIIGAVHDYIICFCKDESLARAAVSKIDISEERRQAFSNPDNDQRGDWSSVDMTAQTGRAPKSQYYQITLPSGRVIEPPDGRAWGISQKTFLEMRKDGRIWFGKEGDNVPRMKRFLSESQGQVVSSFWDLTDAGSNDAANKEVREILGGSEIFNNPKPTKLIKRIIQIASKGDDLILDFFAGSGTTAHAVLEQNAEDGRSRRFVSVQIPEPVSPESEAGVAGYQNVSDITKERLRRVIAGYGENPKPLDAGFRVFSLASSAFPENTFEPDPDASEEENESALREHLERAAQRQLLGERSPESVAYEVALKEGLSPISKVSEVSVGAQKMLRVEDFELGRFILVWLAPKISAAEARAVAREIAPDGDRSDVVLVALDSALDDSAKANLVANLRFKVL